LCYLQTSCQVVADREIALAMAQRRRVSFEKIAHLQDEVGDMVSIIHPYGGNTLKVLVTELLRRYNQPQPNSDGGAFTDEIEGWRIDF